MASPLLPRYSEHLGVDLGDESYSPCRLLVVAGEHDDVLRPGVPKEAGSVGLAPGGAASAKAIRIGFLKDGELLCQLAAREVDVSRPILP